MKIVRLIQEYRSLVQRCDNDCRSGSDYDQDGDGVNNDTDCDDEDSSSYSGNTEVWYNDVDNDCSGGSDYDQDGDGVNNDTDCDDEDSSSYPEIRKFGNDVIMTAVVVQTMIRMAMAKR